MASFRVSSAAITLLLLFLFPSRTVVVAGFNLADTDGNPVMNGGTYYILPNMPSAKPLTYTTLTWPTSVPFYITESGKFNLKPAAVKLYSPKKILHLSLGMPIFIKFVGDTHNFCKDLHWYLNLNNVADLPAFAQVCGQNGEGNSLVIDAAKGLNYNGYTLSFCYNGCTDRFELGMVELGSPDNLFLGYNPSNPLPVVFQKVEETSSI